MQATERSVIFPASSHQRKNSVDNLTYTNRKRFWILIISTKRPAMKLGIRQVMPCYHSLKRREVTVGFNNEVIDDEKDENN